LPLIKVKSSSGTANQVAIAPPLALRQSRQLQSAMKVGSVLNSNLTAPHAQRAVCFFAVVSFLLGILGGLDPNRLRVYKGMRTEV